MEYHMVSVWCGLNSLSQFLTKPVVSPLLVFKRCQPDWLHFPGQRVNLRTLSSNQSSACRAHFFFCEGDLRHGRRGSPLYCLPFTATAHFCAPLRTPPPCRTPTTALPLRWPSMVFFCHLSCLTMQKLIMESLHPLRVGCQRCLPEWQLFFIIKMTF